VCGNLDAENRNAVFILELDESFVEVLLDCLGARGRRLPGDIDKDFFFGDAIEFGEI